jgi:hypothetical protein
MLALLISYFPNMSHLKVRWLAIPLAAVAVIALGGCTRTARQQVETQPSANTQAPQNTQVNVNDQQVTITGNDENTTFSFGGGELPNNWPGDLPAPQGGTVVVAASENNEDGSVTYTGSFSSRESISDAANAMQQAFERAGWKVSGQTQGEFGIAVAGFEATKGDNEADVSVSNLDFTGQGGTSITISATYR